MINLIEDLRKAIDELDEEILNNLTKRKSIVKEIAALKKSMKVPVLDKEREIQVLENLRNKAREYGLNIELIDSIYSLIFDNSRIEQDIENSDSKCTIKEIGLIGFGRFGKLAAKYLSEDFKVHVFHKSKSSEKSKIKNIIFSALGDVCRKDIVIIALSTFFSNSIDQKPWSSNRKLVKNTSGADIIIFSLIDKIASNSKKAEAKVRTNPTPRAALNNAIVLEEDTV